MRRCPRGPDDESRRNKPAVSKVHPIGLNGRDPGFGNDLDGPVRKFASRILAELRSEFGQNLATGMDENHSYRTPLQTGVIPQRVFDEIVDGSKCLHSGKTATGDDEREETVT